MPFSSAPAAQQQKAQDTKLEGTGKKPKKQKHKKESKEKKHKKHKKEKKSKAGTSPFVSLLMQNGTPALLPSAGIAGNLLLLRMLYSLDTLCSRVLH